MLRRLANWCYRRRRLVVVLWVVALIGVSAVGSSAGSKFAQGFSLPATESQRAADLLQSRFPARAGDEGQIVFAASVGVQDAAVRARMEQLFADVAEVPHVTGVVSPYAAEGASQLGRDGDVAYANVQFDRESSDIPTASIEQIRKLTDAANGDGVRVALGGKMFQQMGSLGPAELIGILAAIVILLVAFGSLLAMGLPILIALFGIGIGLGLVELMSHVIATPDFATQLASMIGIGVGIDYALFIVTRYRQGLTDGLDPEGAVIRAVDTAGRAVVFAGTTVVISLLGLFLMGVGFVNGMAVGTSITVAIVMLASITLLPAVLGFAGLTIDKFSIRRNATPKPREQSMWFKWSRIVQRRPWPAFAGGLAILLLLAIPLLSMRLAFPDAGGNPTADTTRRAYDLVADGFGAGFNGPLILAAEFPAGTDPATLDPLVARLRATDGVAAVTPATISPSGDAAVIRVIPSTSPQSEATTELLGHLRNDVLPAAVAGTDVQVHVGGLTASSVDVSQRLSARLPIFIGAVLLLSFLLLLAVFRSILVPLKAVIMNLLSIGAAYGVVVAVFEWGWFGGLLGVEKTGPIAPFVPMMMFAILFGLSMDYEVFLLSRIREEYDLTHDNALAVADGLASTARVITAAALIMVTVFGSFVLGDSTTIKLFGLGLSVAILIDATVVRMVLVPATMELLGDRNWWFPNWLDRIIPRLHVEAAPDVDAELARLTEEEPAALRLLNVRAARCLAYGTPESLVVDEVADPAPGAGEVLVDIHAAAVNFPDVLIVADEYQVSIPVPFVPGSEFAGVVAAVGDDVHTVDVGDAVAGATFVGAFAERIVVGERGLTRLPPSIDLREAAAFGVTYNTAYHSLRSVAAVQPDDWVVVLGAAGGVGLAAVELAQVMGARVLAAASSAEKLELCRARGAEATVDYSQEDLKARIKEITGGGADVVLDPVGGPYSEPALRATRWGGRFVVLGFAAGEIPRIPLNLVLLKGVIVRGFEIRTFGQHAPDLSARDRAELLDLFFAGRIHPYVSRVVGLDDTGSALRSLADRTATGKVLIDPRR